MEGAYDEKRSIFVKVLTINIHKGFTAFNRRFILPELRDAVRSVSADIVCLQEVMGAHEVHPLHSKTGRIRPL
jgi:endonuclease/exonuclease/phosphatase family metal-dependent hydrolase